MKATEAQKQIIQFAFANEGKVTKREAVDLLKHRYFLNESQYVGEILTRMVKAGMLTRIKPAFLSWAAKCSPRIKQMKPLTSQHYFKQ